MKVTDESWGNEKILLFNVSGMHEHPIYKGIGCMCVVNHERANQHNIHIDETYNLPMLLAIPWLISHILVISCSHWLKPYYHSLFTYILDTQYSWLVENQNQKLVLTVIFFKWREDIAIKRERERERERRTNRQT